MRHGIVDLTTRWSKRSGIPVGRFIGWIGISESKYYDWRRQYGQANQHNGRVPRTFWLEEWEQKETGRCRNSWPIGEMAAAACEA